MVSARKAVLAIYDESRSKTFKVEITWEKEHDIDAHAKVPRALAARWKVAMALIAKRSESVDPYGTQIHSVPASKLGTSCTGHFAVAREAWPDTRWELTPPYENGPERGYNPRIVI
jgi:hypothetical protein